VEHFEEYVEPRKEEPMQEYIVPEQEYVEHFQEYVNLERRSLCRNI
jgi:hypothetical protein